MGVWKNTGQSGYRLNHFALSFDTSENFVGPTQIREHITLAKQADQYSGKFKIDQYDPSGKLLQEVLGAWPIEMNSLPDLSTSSRPCLAADRNRRTR